jgi:hypothetical protein
MTDAVKFSDLDPVIQSALGILRESAGLLVHIAGFGVALVSDPKSSRPKTGTKQAGSAARGSADVIPFAQRETSNRRLEPGRKRS